MPGENATEVNDDDPKTSRAERPPRTPAEIGNRLNSASSAAASPDATLEQEFEEELYRFFLEYRLARKNSSLKDCLEGFERAVISRTLRELGGNQKAAARFLGLKYTTLNEKVKKQRIQIVKVTEESLFARYHENLRTRVGNSRTP